MLAMAEILQLVVAKCSGQQVMAMGHAAKENVVDVRLVVQVAFVDMKVIVMDELQQLVDVEQIFVLAACYRLGRRDDDVAQH